MSKCSCNHLIYSSFIVFSAIIAFQQTQTVVLTSLNLFSSILLQTHFFHYTVLKTIKFVNNLNSIVQLNDANTAQINRQRIWSEQMDAYKTDVMKQYSEREENVRVAERQLATKRKAMDEQSNIIDLKSNKITTLENNQKRLIEAEAALNAESRRTSTLALELEATREHVKVISNASKVDRDSLSKYTKRRQ